MTKETEQPKPKTKPSPRKTGPCEAGYVQPDGKDIGASVVCALDIGHDGPHKQLDEI